MIPKKVEITYSSKSWSEVNDKEDQLINLIDNYIEGDNVNLDITTSTEVVGEDIILFFKVETVIDDKHECKDD